MSRMTMLLQISVFLWISVECSSVPQKSEASLSSNLPAWCEFVSRNVCFEFVRNPKTWCQARSSCEEKGGKLLEVLDNSDQFFMGSMTRESNTSNFTWWMGERGQIDNGHISRDSCRYIKLNPLQLLTSDCSEKRGFLCTYSLTSSPSRKKTFVSSNAPRSRLRRNIDDMGDNVGQIEKLLKAADGELRRMEQTEGEPTDDNRKDFLRHLLEGTKQLTPEFALENEEIVQSIVNCSTGILRLSQTKCDIETNPNPKTLFEDTFEIIRAVYLLVGTENSVTKYDTSTVYQRVQEPSALGSTVLGSEEDGEYIKLPSYSAMASYLQQYDKVVAQMATFNNNPHPSDDNISGIVCNIILSDGKSDIKMQNLTEKIEIFLHRPNASALLSNTVELEKYTKSLTRLNVSDHQMTIVFDVEPSLNVSLSLFLSHTSPPTSTHFTKKTVLSHKGGYRWMITPEMLNGTSGVWYVDTRLDNYTQETSVKLTITSFMGKCLYWDTDKLEWRTDGCMVGDKSTPEMTQCLCNHLTLFGSSFFVMPNYVDVSRTAELFATVTQNYVVLALLCAFFSLYLITLFWACYADRRSRSKRKMTLLDDNHLGAQYNYLICVQTGHRKNAGTSANVTVKLIGSEGDSTTHNLTDPDKPVFERGATDIFLLATPFPLGEMKNLRLQHDGSGGHASWFIKKVTIQDLRTRNVWHFFCDCWLSADKGDGLIKKTFNAAKSNEIASFRNIFQTRTLTGFRDEHIWVSIVDPPSRSPFTRAQRVSCCMSLLLCTMAINIAFWNIPLDENSRVIFSLGSLQITWQEIMVGVQSGLLMFPINILIITIFRSIRPRVVSTSKKDVPAETFKLPQVNLSNVLKEIEEIISLLGMSPRNKMHETFKLESSADLCPALDRVHDFLRCMQGEAESDNHWLFCSKFILSGLCHLLMCLKKLDGKNFTNEQEYQYALHTTNTLVLKAEMVLSYHLSNCPPPVMREKKTSSGCRLPWWFVFLGWFLLLSISAISTYFTLLYGFEYGKEKSIKWVMSLGLSLFESIFILQPLKVIGLAVFFALLLKPVALEETEEVEQVLLEQRDRCRLYTDRETL
ncbi:polycystin-1-like protein 2 isoform X2 [Cololabis saira]|uniref:polycystin-1-like protein 2 isoform X2 n=1 Tax=Cololabis saira TaxID=129043 RepID=UPI002AD238FB|nr:polycystin-1-like protein 2 isoform X2 [Cololabis saira]